MRCILHDEFTVNKACIVLAKINPAFTGQSLEDIRATIQDLANQYAGASAYVSTYGFVLSFWDTADEDGAMQWFAKVSIDPPIVEKFLETVE